MYEPMNLKESRIFLYEVVFFGPGQSFARRFSKEILRVPISRMSSETRRILRSGGKILSVQSLASERTLPAPPDATLPWWVEIATAEPKCLYYFGPFDSYEEALSNRAGYVEDLESESARGIETIIKQGQPVTLTVEDF